MVLKLNAKVCSSTFLVTMVINFPIADVEDYHIIRNERGNKIELNYILYQYD